jgi:hypothetical protein
MLNIPMYYSAHGEELVVERLIFMLEESPKRYKRSHKYMDVGCGHPTLMNNTYYHYKLGYKGLVVETNSSHFRDIREVRPDDIAYHVAITDRDNDTVILCDNALLGTPLGDEYNMRDVVRREEVSTMTMKSLLNNHPEFNECDFLSLDIDGSESLCLKGCDFTTYKPFVILIENIVREIDQTDMFCEYLDPFYHYIGNVGGNGIYMRNEWFYPYFVDEHNKRLVV